MNGSPRGFCRNGVPHCGGLTPWVSYDDFSTGLRCHSRFQGCSRLWFGVVRPESRILAVTLPFVWSNMSGPLSISGRS